MTQFLGILLDPFIDGRARRRAPSGVSPMPRKIRSPMLPVASEPPRARRLRHVHQGATAQNYDPHWSVWAAGFGGSQSTDGNTAQGSNNTTSRIFGMAAGADYIFSRAPSPALRWPAAGRISASQWRHGPLRPVPGRRLRPPHVGRLYLRALAYGWQDITTNRTVTIAGVDQLQARFNANAFSGRVEALSFCHALDRRHRRHALRRRAIHDVRYSAYAEQVLSGANTLHWPTAQRVSPTPAANWVSARQILRGPERRPDPARPRRLGARLQSGPRHRATFQSLPVLPSSSTAPRKLPTPR